MAHRYRPQDLLSHGYRKRPRPRGVRDDYLCEHLADEMIRATIKEYGRQWWDSVSDIAQRAALQKSSRTKKTARATTASTGAK